MTLLTLALVVLYFITPAVAFALDEFQKRQWQFSLRTLLIATTIIAVVLGLFVWSMK
jgi:hypothetical protein